MKILHAASIRDNPSFQHFQTAAAGHGADFEFSVERFWRDDPADWDILQLHWPEALIGWGPPSRQQLEQLAGRLRAWRRQTPVVALVHNSRPHYGDKPEWEELYDLTYEQVDGVIHMGRASLEEYEDRYPHHQELPHSLIHFGLSSAFNAEVSSGQARLALRLRPEDFVITAVGALRHTEEIRLLLRAFALVRSKRKRLVIAARKIPLGRAALGTGILLARVAADPRMRLSVGRLPDARVALYVQASDVLVVPRKVILNSGAVPLGFALGRVVVGPDRGVVGEVLRDTGNPVFNPESSDSFARALERGENLAREGKGARNRAYGEEQWNWDRTSALYLEFYAKVRAARDGTVSPGREARGGAS